MGEFSVSTTIRAPVDVVWTRLADIGSIREWNPGVKDSFNTNDTVGLGATRHCDLGNSKALEEKVVLFEPKKAITFRITETNLPFQTADIGFILTSRSSSTTTVAVSPVYKLKYGPVGQLLDVVMVRSTYKKGMANLLSGLKRDLESKPQ